ncbi:hypothetical protein Fmac_011030 [Flemingia macrophylla]|uniref:Uncharacterized protein n=1 Tax=Flemingia macrophylla TaxID=520843 RepID=A0ABD1ML98_9FABA
MFQMLSLLIRGSFYRSVSYTNSQTMTNFEPLISCKHTQDTSSNVFYHLSSVNPTGREGPIVT